MALRQSRQILMGAPTLHPTQASALVPVMADFLVPAAGLALNDVIEMFGVPDGMVLVDLNAFVEDLDTGSTLTLDCGVVSGSYGKLLNDDNSQRTCGNEVFAASTIGQTGGLQRMVKANAALITPALTILPIGFKVAAAPAGNVVGARLRAIGFMMPAPIGT